MCALDDRADALYGLGLDRFVAARDALAKALRAEDDRAGAEEIRRLAKPTRAAWAVNVAVREHPEDARALAESARLLAKAQQELLAGGDPSALREAGERARGAVDALMVAAPVSGDATADKVRATLHAATVDSDVLAEVAAGRVVRERVASGFGGLAALAAPGAVRAGGSRQRAGKQSASAGVTPARRPTRGQPRSAAHTTHEEARREEPRQADEQQARATARKQAQRREKLRRANEAEADAERDIAAARHALEQVESALAERRARVRAAEARLKEARRHRERAEA